MRIRKMLIRGFRHSNPPNLMRCLPLSLFFYQVSPIYHKILMTKKKLLILYVFFGIFLWLPTECVYALWKVSLQLFMIFHRGHCKKNFPFWFWKDGLTTAKKSSKISVIRIKTIYNTTKMMSKSRKCHLRETKFEKVPGEVIAPRPL